jgi:hypothetical protein
MISVEPSIILITITESSSNIGENSFPSWLRFTGNPSWAFVKNNYELLRVFYLGVWAGGVL